MANKRPFLDDLLCFLGDAVFQIPVRNFMDENCLIFDADIQTTKDHRDIHEEYKKLVDRLLASFCADSGVKYEDAMKGIKSMSEIPDLKEVFQVIFEQVMAANNFEVFSRVMAKRNLIIQEQALILLIAATGSVPSSFIAEGQESRLKTEAQELRDEKQKKAQQKNISTSHSREQKPQPGSQASAVGGGAVMMSAEKEDDAFLQKALLESKRQHERAKTEAKQEAELVKQAEIESARISAEKAKLEQAMSKMMLQDKLASPPALAAAATPQGPKASESRAPLKPVGAAQVSAEAVSGAQAAAMWLQSSQAEAATGATHSSAAHAVHMQNMSKLNPEELKRRQEFLKEQRDKLLAMKKKEREKALVQAEKTTGRDRPQSARVAKASLAASQQQQPVKPAADPEEEKKLAMRRAIAEKLRSEVIGKH